MEYEDYNKIIEAIMNLYEHPETPIHTDVPVEKALIIPSIEEMDLHISVKFWNVNGYMGEVELKVYPECKWDEKRIEIECAGWENWLHRLYIDKFHEEIDDIDTWKIESFSEI